MMTDSAISVKQLNFYVKSLIEGDKRLNYISVDGEISNFKNHYSSGHWYFTIKDSDASVRCVMFKSAANKVEFLPQDGMRVVLSGRVSLYEKDGQYQFYADSMQKYGEGDLALAFKICKEKLEKEGLFDESTKRPINKNPKRIAVVTSDTGAAVHDICKTLESRLPSCEIVMCPVAVQGVFAAKTIIETLDRVYKLNGIDTIIIGRGGGSAEDLAPFNDEMLARKLYESPFPVISAVGHETDFTICDFICDLRAATPTAAAVLASNDISEVATRVSELKNRMISLINICFERYSYKLNAVLLTGALKNPVEIIDSKLDCVNLLKTKLVNCVGSIIDLKQNELLNNIASLDALSPLKVLNRGFSFVTKGDKAVKKASDIDIGDKVLLMFTDGKAECEVKKKL